MDVTLSSLCLICKDNSCKGLRSLNQRALSILVILTLTTATMFLPVEAYPHPHVRHHRHAVDPLDPSAEPPWWHNPCTVTHADLPHSERHRLSRSIWPLKTQMKNVMNDFQERKNAFVKYCNIQIVDERQFVQSWIPGHTVRAIQREITGKSRHEKITTLLPKLHEDLQRYALTFENLEKAVGDRIETAAFHKQQRSKNLINITRQLRTLLCEVETSLNNSNIPVPHRLERGAFRQNRDWNYKPNYTELCIQDQGVLLAYDSFLLEWQRALNDMRSRGGKGLKRQQSRRIERQRMIKRRQNMAQRNMKMISSNTSRRPLLLGGEA